MAESRFSPDTSALSEAFYDNVKMAFAYSTFTEVLLAMGLKMLELDVPGAESMEQAEKTNYPLREALLNAETVEEHNAACDAIVRRIWQLGRLLPPEADNAAFLVDWTQVRRLLSNLPRLAPSELVDQFEEHAELGSWYHEHEFNEIMHLLAMGNWIAERRFADPFEDIGQGDSPISDLCGGAGKEKQSLDGSTDTADVNALEQRSTPSIFGPGRTLIKQARVLAQRAGSLPPKDIVDLSGYQRDEGLGDDPEDVILTGSDPKMPTVRFFSTLRWWIPNLVYSRLSQAVKLPVLNYSVATCAPAELEAENYAVVCPYFAGWISLEDWQKMPQEERVEITNHSAFSAHVALELLVETIADEGTFGYILPNGTFLRDPSRHCFGPFYLGLAVNGQEEQWRGMYHSELDKPPPQMRWNDYRESIHNYHASPLAVAKLLSILAALTDDDLISCVRLPDFPNRERVQSILLSRLLRIRKTSQNYGKKVHELVDKAQ